MIALSSPLVIGPISPCSRKVRVQGPMPGAEVRIFEGQRLVGSGVATAPDCLIPLLPSVRLHPGAEIFASQHLNGDDSELTRMPGNVLEMPSSEDFENMYALCPFFMCSTCLWFGGIFPGTTITVSIGGAPPISVQADYEIVHVDLLLGLNVSDSIAVTQAALGVSGRPPRRSAGRNGRRRQLVGASDQRRRHFDPQRLDGLEIDDKLEFVGCITGRSDPSR